MILAVNNVTKIYNGSEKTKVMANNNLSFILNQGEVYGLFGHNGAGKTTLVKQIIGLSSPTRGRIELLGKSVQDDPKRARTICSLQPQAQLPLGSLTPAQAVSIMGKMRGGNKIEINKRMQKLFEILDMEEWAHTNGNKISGGILRLTSFCMAVIMPGSLVILDEPTNDVDPVRRRSLWQVIRDLNHNGTAVILVTHNVLEAEKAVDRIAIMHNGSFIAEGTPYEIKSNIPSKMRIEINLFHEKQELETPPWVLTKRQMGTKLLFSVNQSAIPTAISWAGNMSNKGKVIDYALSPTTIEDVYIELTSLKEASL